MHTKPGRYVLGDDVMAVIFGVDGVIINSAQAAATAWKSVLDPFLRTYSAMREEVFVPFDVATDYPRHLHGKPRVEGAHCFLDSRGITLPYDDMRGIVGRQEEFFLTETRRHGATPYRSTIAMIRDLHRCGLHMASVSPEPYGTEILHRGGVFGMFDVAMDGLDAPGTRLPAQTEAALLVQAATRLGISPGRTAVIEESVTGVAAAQRGGFLLIIGVDRLGISPGLAEQGAHIVVSDLAELELREHPIRMSATR